MATDIKISELNEVTCNNDLNHIIINDRENAGDDGITKKIKLENFLTKDIVQENNIINSAVTNLKIAPNTINCSRIANKTITCNQIANDTINNAVLGGNSVDQRVLDSNAHFTIKDLTVCAGCVNISGSGTSCLEVATGITKLSTIRYYWPTTQNGGDKFLKTDGSGNLSWDEAVPGESTALVFAEIMPVGTIIPWGGQTDVPSDKWLICDGSTFNGTQYPDLSAALGDTWGTRSGNNFYRPDLRGRVPLGAGSSTPDANGNQRSFSYTTNGTGSHYGGAFDHCLSVPQLACHTHSFNTSTAQYGAVNEPNNQNVNYLVGQCRATALYNANAAINNQPYINGTGSGSGHNNIQPYATTRYIIKAKPDDIQQFNPSIGPGLSAKDVNSQTSTMTLTSTEIGVKIDNDTLKFDGSNNITLNPQLTATSIKLPDTTPTASANSTLVDTKTQGIAFPFSKYFETEFVLPNTSSAVITPIDHNLGGSPAFTYVTMICTSDDQGYVVGDEIPFNSPNNISNNHGPTLYFTGTQFKLTTYGYVYVTSPDLATSVIATGYNKWKWRVRAWR